MDKVTFIRWWWAVSTVAVRPTCIRPVRIVFAIFTLALFQSECIFVGGIEWAYVTKSTCIYQLQQQFRLRQVCETADNLGRTEID